MPDYEKPRDTPVKIPLDPETAIRAILQVDPKSPPVDDDAETQKEADEETGGEG
jgi:hypothetical protein